jgi:hypothetical protein
MLGENDVSRGSECAVCRGEEITSPVLTWCGHIFCAQVTTNHALLLCCCCLSIILG